MPVYSGAEQADCKLVWGPRFNSSIFIANAGFLFNFLALFCVPNKASSSHKACPMHCNSVGKQLLFSHQHVWGLTFSGIENGGGRHSHTNLAYVGEEGRG
ncbi:hypothetical protein SUGI_0226520 [Cryptomeria japonica]|nr:hypothetical protein SUGI_0226520 [Cryptomeria japonica]